MELLDYIWLGVIVIATIVEAVVPQLVSIWFVPGGLCALIASLCGAPIWLQIVLFLGASALALLLTRPLVKRLVNTKKVSTNADMAIGRTAVVTENINNILGTGRATVLGNSWSAKAMQPDGTIAAGERVTVENIEGVKLIVRKFEQAENAGK